MKEEAAPLPLDDPLLCDQFEKDMKFLQLFLLLVNNSCPIKRVELVWAGDGPAGRGGPGQKFLSTEQALTGPCAHLFASKDLPEPVFCHIVSDYGRHEAESCSLSDQAAERRIRDTGRSEVYRCHAGLVDIAVPVICDGRRHLATLFTGQVLTEAAAAGGFVQVERDTASLAYLDRAKLEDAYHRVPLVSENDIQRTIQVLEVFAEHLATTWKRLADIVRDQQRKQRELGLDKKEFGHLVLEGNLTDQPLIHDLMTRIGFTQHPNRVMVVRFESEFEEQSNSPSLDLLFARAFQAIEELCDHKLNVCFTYLRSKGVCIFFRDEENVDAYMQRNAAYSFARKIIGLISTRCGLKANIGIGSAKSTLSSLIDSYHEACTALIGASADVAIYRQVSPPDEELALAVGKICRSITERRLLNARILLSGLPVMVNKNLGDGAENLTAQYHFFCYVIDALLFAGQQVGADWRPGSYDAGPDKRALERSATIFDLQQSFIRSAGARLIVFGSSSPGARQKLRTERVQSLTPLWTIQQQPSISRYPRLQADSAFRQAT